MIMNGAHLHLMIAHVAPIGSAFTIVLFIFALFKRSKDLKQAAMWFAFLTAVVALVTFLTGDGAEGIVKALPGMKNAPIEPHETFAMFYLISTLVIGAIAVVGLFLSRASASVLHKFVIIVFLLTLLSSYLAVMTGLTGGKIRHTETSGNIIPVESDD